MNIWGIPCRGAILDVGYWMLVVGCWMLVLGCWMLTMLRFGVCEILLHVAIKIWGAMYLPLLG